MGWRECHIYLSSEGKTWWFRNWEAKRIQSRVEYIVLLFNILCIPFLLQPPKGTSREKKQAKSKCFISVQHKSSPPPLPLAFFLNLSIPPQELWLTGLPDGCFNKCSKLSTITITLSSLFSPQRSQPKGRSHLKPKCKESFTIYYNIFRVLLLNLSLLEREKVLLKNDFYI